MANLRGLGKIDRLLPDAFLFDLFLCVAVSVFRWLCSGLALLTS